MSPLEKILFNWLIYTCAVTITAYLLPGVVISGLFAAMVTALVLGFINTIIKPILVQRFSLTVHLGGSQVSTLRRVIPPFSAVPPGSW